MKELASQYLAHGAIFSASCRLRQNPAPPVANQKCTSLWKNTHTHFRHQPCTSPNMGPNPIPAGLLCKHQYSSIFSPTHLSTVNILIISSLFLTLQIYFSFLFKMELLHFLSLHSRVQFFSKFLCCHLISSPLLAGNGENEGRWVKESSLSLLPSVLSGTLNWWCKWGWSEDVKQARGEREVARWSLTLTSACFRNSGISSD